MNICEQAMLITIITCSIFECYPEEEIPVLAAELTQIGDTLAMMLAKKELCQEKNKQEAYDELEEEL